MMAACNQIYIFSTSILKFFTDFCKLLYRYFFAISILTNLIVLAKSTTQGTTCKKDCAAAAFYCNKGLFSKMKSSKGNAKFITFPTKTGLILAIDFALLWALSTLRIKIRKLGSHGKLINSVRNKNHHQIL